MRLDKEGKPAPYQTKAERIAQLEAALELCLVAQSLDEVRAIVLSTRRTDGRWRKPSPLSHAELLKAAQEIDGKG